MAAAKYRPGQVSIGPLWVDAEIRDAWNEFAKGRGSNVRAEIITAMARHMASPPPLPPRPETVPLPAPVSKPKKSRSKTKKV